MVSAVESNQKVQQQWEPPSTAALDERLWSAWLAKGLAEERRSRAFHAKAAKWASIAALMVVAGLWSQFAPYATGVRFAVAVSCVFLISQTLSGRQYILGAAFALMAVIYNPVVPFFTFDSDWQRLLVVASAIPFVISLVWSEQEATRSGN
jgi:hypothetical protein